MKTTTRVAIIGGGVVGCSVLYHLTKLGWSAQPDAADAGLGALRGVLGSQ